jgi:DNA-binding transcriptional regulator YiaG
MNPNQSKAHRLLLTTTACVREAEKQSKVAQREAGASLKKARKQEKVTLERVAEILGVSIFRVCTIEKGDNLTPQLFERYIDAVDAIALNRNTHVRYSARP